MSELCAQNRKNNTAYLVQSMKHFTAVAVLSVAALAVSGRQLLHSLVQSKNHKPDIKNDLRLVPLNLRRPGLWILPC